jgi:hypothetical protein
MTYAATMNQKETVSGKVMAAFLAADFTSSHAPPRPHRERFGPASSLHERADPCQEFFSLHGLFPLQ